MGFQPLNEFYREVEEREKKGRTSGYFAVIPHAVLEDEKLTATDKILYGEISALVNKVGYCYASNRHFQDTLKCSKKTINSGLASLTYRKYIRVDIEKNENGTFRKIWIGCEKPVDNPVDNSGGGIVKRWIRGIVKR